MAPLRSRFSSKQFKVAHPSWRQEKLMDCISSLSQYHIRKTSNQTLDRDVTPILHAQPVKSTISTHLPGPLRPLALKPTLGFALISTIASVLAQKTWSLSTM